MGGGGGQTDNEKKRSITVWHWNLKKIHQPNTSARITFRAEHHHIILSDCLSLLQQSLDRTVDFIFFLRKTLFDFIKSCGGRIDLKFSGVALLGLLYSPKWKRSFFSKGKVPFSMAGSLLRAVQESCSVKEIL